MLEHPLPPAGYATAYSDVVIMYDLHSNSGAIKLNQAGGMLKHLRTGSGTIDICTMD